MSHRIVYSFVLATVLLAAPLLAGDVLLVTSDRDNTLYEDADGATSNGAGMHFFAGVTNQGSLRRGLLHFDVSSIPPGSTIESVVLTLNMSATIVGPQPVSLHRATADWGEGASDAPGQEGGGAPAAVGDATWLHTFFATDFWATPGGDFAGMPSAVTSVDQIGFYSWGTTSGMEADVQAWVDDGSQNNGWVVVGNELPSKGKGGPTAKRFDTREIPDEGTLGPQLAITFLPPVPVELQSFGID